MILPIVKYGDPVLEKRAEDVPGVDDELRQLVDDMFETMYENEGIGLAANQVGSLKRVAVISLPQEEDEEQVIVLVNPEIVERGEEEEVVEEGCLSFPEIRFNVSRPVNIKVEALDMDGKPVEFDVDGLLARVFQHEIDHLNGVLFTDYLRGMQKEMVMTRIKNMKKRGEWD